MVRGASPIRAGWHQSFGRPQRFFDKVSDKVSDEGCGLQSFAILPGIDENAQRLNRR
jgi:hypothetical protein